MNYDCQSCCLRFKEDDIEYRTEDNTFSAPFGDLKVVIGGSIDKVEICPDCGSDLEEVEE